MLMWAQCDVKKRGRKRTNTRGWRKTECRRWALTLEEDSQLIVCVVLGHGILGLRWAVQTVYSILKGKI